MNRAHTLITGCALAGILAVTAQAQGPDGNPRERGRGRPRGPGQPGQAEGQMGGRSAPVMDAGLNRETMLAHFISNPDVAKKLNLNKDQAAAIREHLQNIRKEHIRLRAEQEIAAMEQVRLLAADTVDEARVMAAVEKTGQISIQMAKLQVKPIIAIKKILTPEQLQTAREMIRSRARDFHAQERGPGPQRGDRRRRPGGGPEDDRDGGDDGPSMMPPPPPTEE